jgi:DNA polymerase I-like protein with 3'-5' exonuclease and polymerase domains
VDWQLVRSDDPDLLSGFNNYNQFSIDLETTGLNPHDSRLLLCQIGFPDGKVFVINALENDLDPLRPYIEDRAWLKIVQNAKFEYKFLKYHAKIDMKGVYDTFLAEQLVTENIYTGLAGLTTKYTDETLDKSVRTSFYDQKGDFSTTQLEYAAKDAEILFPIWRAQSPKLEEFKLGQVSELEFDLVRVVGNMELEGVPIDLERWTTKLEEYRRDHEQSRLRMHELLFDDGKMNEQMGLFERNSINLNSPRQIKDAFAKIGLDVNATNERELALIDHPLAKEMLNYRRLQKILSAYGETFIGAIHPFTKRIHADFQQIGTQTGRFSCKEPNLQQMPEEFRHCVSLPGYKIVVADYSQIELRILAQISGDPSLTRAFDMGGDPHTATAAQMFNIPIESVTKDQRFIAKTINFGLAYGMGWTKLRDILNFGKHEKDMISIDETKELLFRYKRTYRKAIEWLTYAGNAGFARGDSETMLGRRRFFNKPSPSSENYDNEVASIKRQAANSVIQGTNADITKLAMLDIFNELNLYGLRGSIILQVHDEIVVLAHERSAETVKEVVESAMINSAKTLLKSVPVKADAVVSDIWKKD